MNPQTKIDRALELLGATPAASSEERYSLLEQKRSVLRAKAESARTPGLKRRCEDAIRELEEAFEALEFAETEKLVGTAFREPQGNSSATDATGSSTGKLSRAPQKRRPQLFGRILIGAAALAGGFVLWDGPARIQATRLHREAKSAEKIGAWEEAVSKYQSAAFVRPTDGSYALSYSRAQSAWLERLSTEVSKRPPNDAYRYFSKHTQGAILGVLDAQFSSRAKELSQAVNQNLRSFAASRLEEVKGFVDGGKFADAYAVVESLVEFSNTIPEIAGARKFIEIAEARHDVQTALAAATDGDFDGADRSLAAVAARDLVPDIVEKARGVVLNKRLESARMQLRSAIDEASAGQLESARKRVDAVDASGLLAQEVFAVRRHIAYQAQLIRVQRLADAMARDDSAAGSETLAAFSADLGKPVSVTFENLINERDFTAFLSALSELGIVRDPQLPELDRAYLLLLEPRITQFTDRLGVESLLGSIYIDQATHSLATGHAGVASYLVARANAFGVAAPGTLSTEIQAALKKVLPLTIEMLPTDSGLEGGDRIVDHLRTATIAAFEAEQLPWIRQVDASVATGYPGLVLTIQTRLGAIDLRDDREVETKTVQYQSGWENAPNPAYIELSQRIAAERANMAASNAMSAQVQAGGGALGLLAQTISNVQQVTNPIPELEQRLIATPSTVRRPTYAQEPYEIITHRYSYAAKWEVVVNTPRGPIGSPLFFDSSGSQEAIEVVGNAARGVPVKPIALPSKGKLASVLGERLVKALQQRRDELTASFVEASFAALDEKIKSEQLSPDIAADLRWGLTHLWGRSAASTAQLAEAETDVCKVLGLARVAPLRELAPGAPRTEIAAALDLLVPDGDSK